MAYIGTPPSNAFTSLLKQDFSTSATTGYTLDHAVNNANDIALFINFVRQEPTAGYAASGTTLTLTSATASSDDMYCVYLGQALQTVNPANASVGSSQLSPIAITGQTAETSIADGDTILIHDASASALRKMTKANFVSGIGGANTPAFMATMSANQSLSHNTSSKVQFNTEVFDTDSAYDTSNYRFTVPSGEDGKYHFQTAFGVYDSANTLQQVNGIIKKNGSEITNIRFFHIGSESRGVAVSLSVILPLVASDYIEVFVYEQESGANSAVVNTSGNTTQYFTYFSGYKLIGI